VMQAIVKTIRERLSRDDELNWSNARLDLTDSIFRNLNLNNITLAKGSIDFSNSRFEGDVDFQGLLLEGGQLNFANSSFRDAHIRFIKSYKRGEDLNLVPPSVTLRDNGRIGFEAATFEKSTLLAAFAAVDRGASIEFTGATFDETMVPLQGLKLGGGTVTFGAATLRDSAVFLNRAEITGGLISFDFSTAANSQIIFDQAQLSGGRLEFFSTTLSENSSVSFSGVSLTGTHVDLTNLRTTEQTRSPIKVDFAEPPPGFDAPPEMQQNDG